MRIVREVTVKTALAGVVLLGGVAAANAIRHQSPSASTTSSKSATSTVATTANTAATSGAARVTLVASPTPSVRVTPVSGVVTAVSSSSLTIRSATGPVTYSLNPATVVLQGRAKSSIAAVKVGARVFVVGSATSPSTASAIGLIPSSAGHESEGAGAETDY